MAIFVPPAVLDEEDAVFNLPMIANVCQQFVGADLAGINAGQEVASVVQAHCAIFRGDVVINAEGDLAAREFQLLADVVGVV